MKIWRVTKTDGSPLHIMAETALRAAELAAMMSPPHTLLTPLSGEVAELVCSLDAAEWGNQLHTPEGAVFELDNETIICSEVERILRLEKIVTELESRLNTQEHIIEWLEAQMMEHHGTQFEEN